MSALNGLIDTALDISQRRREIFLRLRAAVKRGDKDATFSLAAEYCNVKEIPHEQEKSNRVDTRIN